MPPALAGDDSMSEVAEQQHDAHETNRPRSKLAVQAADAEAVVLRQRNTPNKQSWDYVWRSGLAGGFAGCAVCLPPKRRCPLDRVLGC